MDAREYMRELERCLKSIGLGVDPSMCYGVKCEECPFWDGYNHYCLAHSTSGVDILEKWVEKHPRRTRLQILKESFPDCVMAPDGEYPIFCPYMINKEWDCGNMLCEEAADCVKCWNKLAE